MQSGILSRSGKDDRMVLTRKNPEVCVLILNWNGKENTLSCLESMSRQRYSNFSLAVVDNGSTDGSVNEIRKRFPHAVVIENGKNLGYADGNNEGLRWALKGSADYFFILNNDTQASEDLLEKLVEAAENDRRASVLGPQIFSADSPEETAFAAAGWNEEGMHFYLREAAPGEALMETEVAHGCAMFFHRRILESVGYFDPRFFLCYEEIDWSYRARGKGFKIKTVLNAKLRHKGSQSFSGGNEGPLCQYYNFRNRLLWMEKQFHGLRKWKAFARSFKHAYWGIFKLGDRRVSEWERQVTWARLLGGFHYLIRRFGEAPQSLSGVLGESL